MEISNEKLGFAKNICHFGNIYGSFDLIQKSSENDPKRGQNLEILCFGPHIICLNAKLNLRKSNLLST